jgi:acyl dehydratase/CBS domain-containing protein
MLTPITVREVMQSPVETTTPDASVRAAARQLVEAGVGSLVVCRAGEPVGIVTEVDLTELLAAGSDPATTTVADVMAAPLVTVGPDAPIEDAATRMREATIKRLPVVESGEVVGILTTTDLSNFLPHLVRLGRGDEPAGDRARRDVRTDTAYEDDDWEYEYVGHEAEIDVGDAARFTKTVSADDVAGFAEASGDTNRLHLDEEFAARTRFGERIVHGTLVAGLVSAALARLPGLTIYLSQDLSFLAPVPLGERLTADCEVVEDLGNRRFRLTTAVRDAEGETVIDGEATVVSDAIPEGED